MGLHCFTLWSFFIPAGAAMLRVFPPRSSEVGAPIGFWALRPWLTHLDSCHLDVDFFFGFRILRFYSQKIIGCIRLHKICGTLEPPILLSSWDEILGQTPIPLAHLWRHLGCWFPGALFLFSPGWHVECHGNHQENHQENCEATGVLGLAQVSSVSLPLWNWTLLNMFVPCRFNILQSVLQFEHFERTRTG